ncbi:MAG TPA: hypothetical protein DEQ39_10925 [Atlantibacter hermannii]|nr:hypothetical protein [Atlantibacter hermannii]
MARQYAIVAQFAFEYVISCQSSFFAGDRLGYHVEHSAARGQDPVKSDFCRLPGLTLSAVGVCSYTPNDLYSARYSLD